jgi:hypothetical protein
MHATYNSRLIALSIAVAVLVSSFAFRLAARVVESDRTTRRYGLVGGAIAMGIGIWSMHFIGRPAPARVIEAELRARTGPAAPECLDPSSTYARLAHPVWGGLLAAKSI